MKILIYFGAMLTIANTGYLNSLEERSRYYGGSGSRTPFGEHTETIRVIQGHGGYAPQYALHGLTGSHGVNGGHIDTVRVIQENGVAPAFHGHVETVRVIQDSIGEHINHNGGGGHIDTIQVIQEDGGYAHNGVSPGIGGHVNTVRIIEEAGPIGSQAIGPIGSGGHIETIRIIQDNNRQSNHDGGPSVGDGQVFGGESAIQTIRLIKGDIHSDGGPRSSGNVNAINHFNSGPVETIRVIQHNVVNQLGNGPIGGDHRISGHVQTIRVIKEDKTENHFNGGNGIGHISGEDVNTIRVIKDHSGGYSNGYHYSHPGHSNGHSNLVQIIAAAAGGEAKLHSLY